MHELSLLSTIPPSRHDQLLNIFAGLSAMQPVPFLEKHLIFRPDVQMAKAKQTRAKDTTLQGREKEVQDVQRALQGLMKGSAFFVRVVGVVREGSRDDTDGDGDKMAVEHGAGGYENGEKNTISVSAARWTIEFRDIPEAGRRPVTSRLMADIAIPSGDTVGFMEEVGYSYVSSYYLSGHRFTHQNVLLLLHRPLFSPSEHEILSISGRDASDLQLLDPTGTYIIQVSLRVQDGSKVELMSRGTTELLSLKETFKGVIELEVGDRLAMDTRVPQVRSE